jgi:hypothetical protein
MPLLDEIRDGAIACGADFDTTLRRAYLLATRLGYEPFQSWVTSELRGYARDAELPSYRVLSTSIWYEATAGHTRQSGIATWDFFHGNEDARKWASKIDIRLSVAELVSWADASDDVKVIPTPVVQNQVANHVEQSGFNLLSTRQIIAASAVRGLLSNICTSLLQFVLEIEKLYPEAGDEPLPHNPEIERAVAAVFNQVIVHGGSPSFSMASGINPVATSVATEQKVILAGELTNLLRTEGLDIDDLAEVIDDAIVEDVDQQDSGVGQWIERASEAARSAGKTISEEALKLAVRQVLSGNVDFSVLAPIFT